METHNFTLTEEQAMVQEQLRKLVQTDIEPVALERDEHRTFVRDNVAALGELGMLGLPLAEDSGGAGFGMLAFAVALEEIGRACGSTARLLLSQAGLCGKALEGVAAASETCQALAMGEKLGAFVGPEFGVAAEQTDGGVVVSGCASMVTAAAEAEVFVVAATCAGEPALLVLDAALVERAAVPALGFRASGPGSVAWRDVAVPAETLVARGADAEAALGRVALAAAIGGGAIAAGSALASYELGRKHAGERIAFGKPLSAQQAVAHKLVRTYARAQAAKHLVWHAARLADAGEDALEAAAMARLDAVAAGVDAADEGIQIMGGYGYVVEYHVERHYRDMKTLEVLDRGAEFLRDQLARRLAI